jgi:anti-sigma factor RsiW
MKCTTVRSNLAGYLDDAITGSAPTKQRSQMREHLEACGSCREELERYRKLAVLMSRVPRSVPPADLAVRIRVAAAQAHPTLDLASRWRRMRDRAEILLDNVFRPISVPATGGLFSAILVFVLVLQLMVPGITVQAVANDVPLNTNILRPAELIALSDYPSSWAPEQHDVELSLPHGLLVDVTVDQNGKMMGYEIISGPKSRDLRHQLDQMLILSRFQPMMSFGRPTAGGHVILSFSAVRVRG